MRIAERSGGLPYGCPLHGPWADRAPAARHGHRPDLRHRSRDRPSALRIDDPVDVYLAVGWRPDSPRSLPHRARRTSHRWARRDAGRGIDRARVRVAYLTGGSRLDAGSPRRRVTGREGHRIGHRADAVLGDPAPP